MKIRKKLVAITFGVTLLITILGGVLTNLGTAPTSAADLAFLKFAYSSPGITAHGVLVADSYDSKTRSFQITRIKGERNGAPIDSLLPPDYHTIRDGIETSAGLGNDNLLQARFPQLNESGFSYTAGGEIYNVYYSSGDYFEVAYSNLITEPLTSFSAQGKDKEKWPER